MLLEKAITQPGSGHTIMDSAPFLFETELTSDGVLSYVMKKLKMEVLQDIGGFADEKQSESDDSQSSQPITFELLEERHNNFQPLLDDEYKEVMDNIGDIMESSFRGSKMHLQKNTIIKRLTEALELIIDLLESDFLVRPFTALAL
ncbi:hypothetical protein J6590_003922 [Homalodisca vitripennis]|nr:hypothetical protein J6590_003922 [Homalodisca vitripennis]